MNASQMIRLQLNGQTVEALPGETLLQLAQREGIDVPHLCYKAALRLRVTAAPAWSKWRANVPWPPRVADRPQRAWWYRPIQTKPSPRKKWFWNCCWLTCPGK